MGKLKTTIIDDSFNQKLSYQYQLFILVGMNSFLYLAIDHQDRILLLKEYSFDQMSSLRLPGERIHSLFKEDRHLNLSYEAVKVAFIGMEQAFVPNRLYEVTEKATYLAHVSDLKSSQQIEVDELLPLAAQNIYPVDRATINFLQQMFPKMSFFHLTSALYLTFQQQTLEKETGVFFNLRDEYLQAFLFRDKELLFSASYHTPTAKDFVYYVMVVFEQFKLDPQEQVVHIAGNFQEGGEHHQELYRYIKYIQAVAPVSGYKFSKETAEKLYNHLFFDLMSIKHCSKIPV